MNFKVFLSHFRRRGGDFVYPLCILVFGYLTHLAITGRIQNSELWMIYIFKIFFIAGLEWVFPYDRRQNQIKLSVIGIDALYFFLRIYPGIFVIGLYDATFAWLPAFQLGFIQQLQLAPWTELIIVALLLEFSFYWIHRGQHSVPVLRRFHATHHSSTQFYTGTWFRAHILDDFFYLLVIFLLVTVGFNFWIIQCWAMLLHSTFTQLSHTNIRANNPLLRQLFVTNEVHRAHHSVEFRLQQKNFGAAFLIFDHVFGTYLRKDQFTPPDEYGIAPGKQLFSRNFISQLLGRT